MADRYETTNKHEQHLSIAEQTAQNHAAADTAMVETRNPPPMQFTASASMEEQGEFSEMGETQTDNYLLTVGAGGTPNDLPSDENNEDNNLGGQQQSPKAFQAPSSPDAPVAMPARFEANTETVATDSRAEGQTFIEQYTEEAQQTGEDRTSTPFVFSDVGTYLNEMAEPVVQRGWESIGKLAGNEKQTAPAPIKLEKAEKAVISPPGEGQSKSNNKQVIKIGDKPQPTTNEAQAKSQFQNKLQTSLPKKLKEVDEFKENGKANQIIASARQVIQIDAGQVDDTYGEIRHALAPEAADPHIPLGPPKPAQVTDALNLGADMIAPLKPEHTDFTTYEKDADEALEKEGITDMHLDMVNAGELMEVKTGRAEMKEISLRAPNEIEEIRTQSITQVDQQLASEDQKGRSEMRQIREKELGNVKQEQEKVKTELEQKRAEVATKVNQIYNGAKFKVQAKLTVLNSVSLSLFQTGLAAATKTFEDNVDRRFKDFKDDRYGGLFGWTKWLGDLFRNVGEFDEVKEILNSEKAAFVTRIDTLIADITAKNEQTIEECRGIVEGARTEIAEYVDGLDPELRAVGEQAQEDIQAKLDQLNEEINQKEEELRQLLEQKKLEAVQMIDEKIKEIKEKMSGLLSKIFKFLGELAIKFLKWALNSLGLDADAFINAIRNIGEALVKIIKDPGAFFQNLVAAVKGGFQDFFGNAASNLFSVLIEWITNGAAGNLVLPTEWTLKNILKMVLDFFNIGWESIKEMFAEQLGPAVVDYAIGAAELIQNIITDGPVAIWNMIKGHASDGWDYAKEKMADKIGQEQVDKIEMFAELLQKLVTEGPIAMWELIKEKGSEIIGAIKDMIIDALVDWGITKIIKKGVEFLFTIATGFIAAIAAIYRAVMFFINNMDKIGALVMSLLGTIGDAAAGNVGAGIARISSAISLVLSLLLDLLARLLGIADVPAAVGNAIEKAVSSVQDFLAKAVKWVADLLKGIWNKIKGWFVGDDDDQETSEDYNNLSHDEKVREGLDYLHKVEQTFIKDDKITEEDAQQVVEIVKEGKEDQTERTGKGQIFSKLEVTDKDANGEPTDKWNYLYAASPENVEGGWWKWLKDEALKLALETAGVDPQQFMDFVGDAGAVIDALRDNPGQFINNLVDSVKGGFNSYTTNIGENIKSSLAAWITGESGMTIPADWNVKSVYGLALDALDIEWNDIKGYLINELGAPVVEIAEQGFSFISTVIQDGPIALYNDMTDAAAEIQGTVIEGIKSWAITEILEKGALWLMTFITPASGLVNVVKSIWRTIQFFYNEAQRIVQLLTTIGQSITNIAAGNIEGAISFIANGLNTMTTLLISFLAKQLGINGIRRAIRDLLDSVRARIRRAIQYAAKKLAGYIRTWGKEQGQDFRTPGEKQDDLDKAINEADVHVLDKDLDDEETAAKFPAIKSKYNMNVLQLVTASETETEMVVYAHGEINPKKDGKQGTKPKQNNNPYKAQKRADGKIVGNFSNFVWTGYPNHSVDPHPVNKKYGHKNGRKIPKPTGNYVMPMATPYGGAPSTDEWRKVIKDEKDAQKVKLANANPSWKPGKIENEAKKSLERKYGLVWLDLDLRGWQAHHIHPRDWGGGNANSNWQYLKENPNGLAGEKNPNQHSPFTNWWDNVSKPKLLSYF